MRRVHRHDGRRKAGAGVTESGFQLVVGYVYEGSGTEPEPDPCENLHRQIQTWIDTKPFKAPSKKKLVAALGG